MGKSNAAMKEYIGRKERFADLFNYFLFQGDLVIKSEDLDLVDGESDIIIDDVKGKEQEIHRYRDITMRWKYGCDFTILACENQKKVHYAMPVRNMMMNISRTGCSLRCFSKKAVALSVMRWNESELIPAIFGLKSNLLFPKLAPVIWRGGTS